MRAPRKTAVGRSNEAQILRAAERVFARAGFAGARVADIARLAGIPKANLHYYFKSKRALYRAVLDNILRLWLAETDIIRKDVDPRVALESYLRAKMRFSRLYPDASRVFANEIIHGAPEIGGFLRTDMKALVDDRCAVLGRWIAAGRMAPLDPRHLFFAIWAITQTYADFEAQVGAVLGVRALTDTEFEAATDQVVGLVLRGCGFYFAPPERREALVPEPVEAD
jgi:TetR/AcrR family transcriptional regulator